MLPAPKFLSLALLLATACSRWSNCFERSWIALNSPPPRMVQWSSAFSASIVDDTRSGVGKRRTIASLLTYTLRFFRTFCLTRSLSIRLLSLVSFFSVSASSCVIFVFFSSISSSIFFWSSSLNFFFLVSFCDADNFAYPGTILSRFLLLFLSSLFLLSVSCSVISTSRSLRILSRSSFALTKRKVLAMLTRAAWLLTLLLKAMLFCHFFRSNVMSFQVRNMAA